MSPFLEVGRFFARHEVVFMYWICDERSALSKRLWESITPSQASVGGSCVDYLARFLDSPPCRLRHEISTSGSFIRLRIDQKNPGTVLPRRLEHEFWRKRDGSAKNMQAIMRARKQASKQRMVPAHHAHRP